MWIDRPSPRNRVWSTSSVFELVDGPWKERKRNVGKEKERARPKKVDTRWETRSLRGLCVSTISSKSFRGTVRAGLSRPSVRPRGSTRLKNRDGGPSGRDGSEHGIFQRVTGVDESRTEVTRRREIRDGFPETSVDRPKKEYIAGEQVD